ncbi:hypothetical protein [Nisaea sp.]|uniref:glycosyltransferase n=1 Tax=Nisaea sp. TaxID=2024842 RepID=UPI002B277997|nr:hypothetical protein [Nisaea sp.]
MIGFVLAEGEPARAEKRRFYQGQIDRLRAVGLEAGLYEFSDDAHHLPDHGAIAVFDVACRKFLRRYLDERRIPHAPIVWNPYIFFKIDHHWISTSDLVLATLAPGEESGRMLQKFALGKSVETLRISAEYLDFNPSARNIVDHLQVSRIGCFGSSQFAIDFIKGILTRGWPELAECEWVDLDAEALEEWRDNLAGCDVLISLRGLCGSALPLLDAMASGIVVAGTHGGGLRDVACPENGIWINSATLETVAEELSDGLLRLAADPVWHRQLIDRAFETAIENSVDATFGDNLEVWKRLTERALSA